MTIIDVIQNFTKTLPGNGSGTEIREVARYLLQMGCAVVNYDPVQSSESRMLIRCSRKTDRNSAIADECNSTIIDYSQWSLLYRAPALPVRTFHVASLRRDIAQYRITKIYDGTVLGLYHYQGEWRISTANGIDMAGMRWCGVSYGEALEQVAPGIFDKLDTAVSYTVGVTHPGMHYTQQPACWLIHAVDTSTGQPAMNPGIAEAEEVVATFDELASMASDHLYDGFGFVLQGNDRILMESVKMALVRNVVYNRRNHEEAETCGVSHREYVFITSLVNDYHRQRYLRLYPGRADAVARALDLVNDLAKKVLARDPAAVEFTSHVEFITPLATLTHAGVVDILYSVQFTSALARYLVSRLPAETLQS